MYIERERERERDIYIYIYICMIIYIYIYIYIYILAHPAAPGSRSLHEQGHRTTGHSARTEDFPSGAQLWARR